MPMAEAWFMARTPMLPPAPPLDALLLALDALLATVAPPPPLEPLLATDALLLATVEPPPPLDVVPPLDVALPLAPQAPITTSSAHTHLVGVASTIAIG